MQRRSSGMMRLILASIVVLAGNLAANDLAPEVLLENGHWKRLRALAEQRLKANSNDAQAAYHLAYLKFQQGDLDATLGLAEKAAALDPKNADVRYLIAGVYGRKAESAGIFSQLGLARRYKREAEATLVINPLHIDARMGLIEYHLRAPGIAGGDKKKADQYLNEIMRIDPAKGYLALARKANIEKQPAQLEGLYLKALEASPRNYGVLLTLAGFYSADTQKKYDLSENYASDALKAQPNRVGAYVTLAGLYAFQLRWTDLDRIIAEAEKAVPDNFAPYYNAARVLLGSGRDNARAERYFRKYLTQEPEIAGPTHAHAHWRLGLLYEKMGRKPDAVAELRIALQQKPDLEEAKKDLKRLN
jgi:tetratricopeptide (TPR) repeat protein